MDALTLLNNRNSEPKLSGPAPDHDTLYKILGAALRAPDHGGLRPWRFLIISGKARYRLGELFADVPSLYEAGASYVSLPRLVEAMDLCEVIVAARNQLLDEKRTELKIELENRNEVIP